MVFEGRLYASQLPVLRTGCLVLKIAQRGQLWQPSQQENSNKWLLDSLLYTYDGDFKLPRLQTPHLHSNTYVQIPLQFQLAVELI